MLQIDPYLRPTMSDILRSSWFDDIRKDTDYLLGNLNFIESSSKTLLKRLVRKDEKDHPLYIYMEYMNLADIEDKNAVIVTSGCKGKIDNTRKGETTSIAAILGRDKCP